MFFTSIGLVGWGNLFATAQAEQINFRKQDALVQDAKSVRYAKTVVPKIDKTKPLIEFKKKYKTNSRQGVLSQIKSSQIPLSEIVTPWDPKTLLPSRVKVPSSGLSPRAPRGYVTHLTFKRTVIRNPLFIRLSSVSAEDNGTLYNLYLNGQLVAALQTLSALGTPHNLKLKPGNNVLGFETVRIPCGCQVAFVRIDYDTDVLPGEIKTSAVFLQPGVSSVYGPLGFPQIVIPRSRYPETVKHIESAWAGSQAAPIGKNPPDRIGIPKNSPRLVTIDRLGASSRKDKSTAGITCKEEHKNNQGVFTLDQKDEYPPLVTKESFQKVLGVTTASAHVRCIPQSDNGGSGSFSRGQYNGYATIPTATPVMVPNGSTIEFVIGP
jgi:hypothetical protein